MTKTLKSNILGKIGRSIITLLAGILCFVLVYLLVGFLLSSITVEAEEPALDEVAVYILTNGVHTDFVVPTVTDQRNWFEVFDHLGKIGVEHVYPYLAIGWGDKGFYLNTPTWSDLTAATAIKAMIGASGTAIHATYYKQIKESETCKKIVLSREQYRQLLAYFDKSTLWDEDGKSIHIETDAVYGDTDAFYEATSRYSIFKTCNSWANKGLKASGQRACLWTAFQEPIFDKY